jgi:hypothetical protein
MYRDALLESSINLVSEVPPRFMRVQNRTLVTAQAHNMTIPYVDTSTTKSKFRVATFLWPHQFGRKDEIHVVHGMVVPLGGRYEAIFLGLWCWE